MKLKMREGHYVPCIKCYNDWALRENKPFLDERIHEYTFCSKHFEERQKQVEKLSQNLFKIKGGG